MCRWFMETDEGGRGELNCGRVMGEDSVMVAEIDYDIECAVLRFLACNMVDGECADFKELGWLLKENDRHWATPE
jgi:hypothetical protein